MSIEFSCGKCVLISHKTSVGNIYKNIQDSPNTSYTLNSNIFKISSQYLRENQVEESQKRRKINKKKEQIEIEQNKEMYYLVTSKKIRCLEISHSISAIRFR